MSNYNILMNLEAKASRGLPRRRARAEVGYAMAALLVAMTVMAIILTAAMPTWSQMIRREKEEELLFRGNQYARAINQYQRKFANASPATLDVLIEQRLLRKKFRDPFATDKEGEFQMLYLNTQGPASRGMGQTGARGAGTGQQQAGMGGPQAGSATGTTYSTQPAGGIVGVASKNTGMSIKVYKGKQRYNEWQFIGMEQSLQAGGPAGAAGPGGTGRGGRGTGGREGGRGDGGFGGRGEGRGGRGSFDDGGFGGREGRGGGTMITTPDGGTTFIPRGGGPGGGRGSSPNR